MESSNINELPESTAKEIIQKIRHICIFNKDLPYAKEVDRLADALGSLKEYDYSVVKDYFNAGKEYDSIEDYEHYLTEEHERSLEI
jgi:hypothetical protein